ncbi:MAG: N,N-dimethylformamidase beta subunit family domain-containing protein [Solirubrobacteraceae bacterium]
MTEVEELGSSSWKLRRPSAPVEAPPAHRPVHVGSLEGYTDPIGVRPGERLSVHLSAPAAHEVSIARLGIKSVLEPGADDAADRAEATVLATLACPSASRHDIYPGSYAWLDDPSLARPSAISAWVRLWRLPSTVETWSWVALVGELDFPDHCGWVLAIDGEGRPCCYIGDGLHDREWWTFAEASMAQRLGEWVHLACSADESKVRLYVDGILAATGSRTSSERPQASGRVRIGAAAESGVADHFLDADLSSVMLLARPLEALEVRLVTEDRGLSSPAELGIDDVEAYWPMRETFGVRLEDVSGHQRHATIVNAATLGIPGPSASTAIGRPGYDSSSDPMRGGAVRFACDDLIDCRWPSAAEVIVPGTATSGAYCVRVTLAGAQEALEIPFVVVRPTPRCKDSIALVFATFTWTAYARRPVDDRIVPGLSSSFYTRNLGGRMFFHLGMRMPLPRARPFEHATHLRATTLHQHLVRPERLAEAWLAREGYAYECITDVELDGEPELLQRFGALMLVGHNEYWSQNMRDGIEAYLDGGGALLNLSGNTGVWRVTHDPTSSSLEARKTTHATEGDAWLTPEEWGERWHTDGRPGGSWSLIGQPPNQLLGLEMLGWIDSGDPTAFAPFTIRAADHFLLREPEPVPVEPEGLIGTRSLNGPSVSGYEMDGLPQAVGMTPALSTEHLTLIAHAQHGNRYVSHNLLHDPGYGADVIYWERPGGGRVFSAASIGYTGSLAVDPGIQALTRNVLHHYGVARR